ncbi:MAG: hypothetical protein QOG66_3306 [Methylobacteriaceae bacterium]|nr:hypothetical protein [Methylobacteriaceae bacterium]
MPKYVADSGDGPPVNFGANSLQVVRYSTACFRYYFNRALNNIPRGTIIGEIIELLPCGYAVDPLDLIQYLPQRRLNPPSGHRSEDTLGGALDLSA